MKRNGSKYNYNNLLCFDSFLLSIKQVKEVMVYTSQTYAHTRFVWGTLYAQQGREKKTIFKGFGSWTSEISHLKLPVECLVLQDSQ